MWIHERGNRGMSKNWEWSMQFIDLVLSMSIVRSVTKMFFKICSLSLSSSLTIVTSIQACTGSKTWLEISSATCRVHEGDNSAIWYGVLDLSVDRFPAQRRGSPVTRALKWFTSLSELNLSRRIAGLERVLTAKRAGHARLIVTASPEINLIIMPERSMMIINLVGAYFENTWS